MAILHSVYSFDAELFNFSLKSEVIEENLLNLQKMHQIAVEAIDNMEEAVIPILPCLRYDRDWLDATEEDISYSHKWYILALTKYFHPVNSLSDRISNGYSILYATLLKIGWIEDDIKLLINGESLSTLVAKSQNEQFVSEFTAGIDQYGGWIDLEKIKILLSRLEKGRLDLSAMIIQEDERSIEYDKALIIYEDAVEMLRESYSRGHSLFLLLD